MPIRARGTLAGSIAHADPAAELPVALLALGAEVEVRSAAGLRAVPIDAFFTGPFSTVLGPAELVTGVVLPPCRAAWPGRSPSSPSAPATSRSPRPPSRRT